MTGGDQVYFLGMTSREESPGVLKFESGVLHFFQSALAQAAIKNKEKFDGFKGIAKAIWLVVQTPLVAHVALDALLLRKLDLRKFLKNFADDGRLMLIM